MAPLVATRLEASFGPDSVGWYVSAMAVRSVVCVMFLPDMPGRDPKERS